MTVNMLKAPRTFSDLALFRSSDKPLDTDRRKISTEWVLDTHEGTEHGRPATFSTVVALDSYHDKEGKQYRCLLTYMKRVKEEGSRFSVSRFAPFSQKGGIVNRTRVARYSAKTLQEYHKTCLDFIRENFDIAAPVFAEAFERRDQDDL